MTGGSTIIGPWPNKGQTADADTVPIATSDTDHREGERFDAAYLDDEDEIRSHWRRPLAFSLCIVTAIAWVGLIC
jgi:hypothetical protein